MIEHIESWKARERSVVILDLGVLRTGQNIAPRPSDEFRSSARLISDARPSRHLRRKIETMLFADVVGFSKIDEERTPAFFVDFLGQVAAVIDDSPRAPAFSNTWGYGLFVVYDDIIAAAGFALALRDQVLRADWEAHALPANTSVRIGMHAGPVYEAVDPVLRRTNYFGSHVNPDISPGRTSARRQVPEWA